MKTCAIYRIESKIKPERQYIGSAIDIQDRWRCHLKNLRKNKHGNIKLQRHYNKYGETDLVFIIIEPCFPQFLIIREQYYIDTLKPFFNICKKAGSCLGVKRSEETKRKLSIEMKTRKYPPRSEEYKQKLSKALKGIKKKSHSQASKDARSERMKGQPSRSKGHKRSEESKIIASERMKGNIPWNKGLKIVS